MTRSEFLCIGPPKTGTSWLCVMFRELGVPMPPAKEIKYFTEEAYGLSDAALTRRVVGRHWLFRTNRRYLLGMLGNTLKRFSLGQQTDLPGLLWSINFVFGRRSDLWYQNLFNAYGGIGDISPKYCEISSSHVQAVDKRFPNLRIIMFLRDPIERDWSSARMNLCLRPGRDPKDIADSEYIDYFQRSTVTNQSSYNDIINLRETNQYAQ